MAQVLSSPSRVDPRDVRPTGTATDPSRPSGAAAGSWTRIAAALKADPVPLEKRRAFAYRFKELERQIADLESFRKAIDLKRYEVGKTVFDSGN